ncbi:hypothetical protein GJ496_007044 [Pomphorhynchus laevis]|nr:hypothetical protein GJ496_007044 [Pomphorhynchus laevis]
MWDTQHDKRDIARYYCKKSAEQVTPPAAPINMQYLMDAPVVGACDHHDSIFHLIDNERIRTGCQRAQGGAGPSGLDSDDWRGVLNNYASGKIGSTNANLIYNERIRTACQRAQVGAGPSGLDSDDWRGMMNNYGMESLRLTSALAKLTLSC